MIGYVTGTLAGIWGGTCLVVTSQGVGYEITPPAPDLEKLPPAGSDVSFYTYLAVREDALELFGFATFEEKQLFRLLTGISRVGTRTALAILSVYSPDDLRQIVAGENFRALAKVAGIGQKSAQHIFLELKYKLGALPAQKQGGSRAQVSLGVYGDTLAALANLGYNEEECSIIIRDVLKAEPDLDVGGAIRMSLKALAKGKIT